MKTSNRVVDMALFGLGRAGSIHLANMMANPKVKIAYIVESDVDKWGVLKERWNLADTKFLHPKVSGYKKVLSKYQYKRLRDNCNCSCAI